METRSATHVAVHPSLSPIFFLGLAGFRDRCAPFLAKPRLVKLADVRGNLIEFKLGLVINNDTVDGWWDIVCKNVFRNDTEELDAIR